MPDSALAIEVPKSPMEKPDPYSDWVLFGTQEGQGHSSAPRDEELLSAARGAWPRALTQAKRDFAVAGLGSDSDLLASEVWERVLRSVSKTRQRKSNPRPPIADLEIYLIGAFRHRFTRVLLREQRRAERIELASSRLDLEQIESATDTQWVEELEKAIAVHEITDRMDPWTRKVWQARKYGYSWKDISAWLGVTEDQARKKFEYGVEKVRRSIVRLLESGKSKGSA